MAKLTPLGRKALKGLVALTILAVAGAGIWYAMSSSGGGDDEAVASNDDRGGGVLGVFGGGSKSGPLGSKTNPLTVSIVSWHGYVGGLLANGGLETQPGSIYERNGLYVKYILDDDLPTIAERFEPNDAQCIWRTVDFWAQEQPALRSVDLDGRAVMVVDNSRGGDAIIGGRGISSVEDLAGKRVGITEFTPSHMLGIFAINQSSMSRRQRESVQLKPFATNADGLAAFQSGAVDALITWEPETSMAKMVDGAQEIFSTRQATELIYDVMVCNKATIDSDRDVIQKFVSGWLEGATEARANPSKGADVLVAAEPLFAELEREHGRAFLTGIFDGIVWTNLEDNIRIMGLAGGKNYAEARYDESDAIWRENTKLLEGMQRVLASDAFDYSFVQALMDVNPQAATASKVPQFTFNEAGRDQATTAALTKPIEINFKTGSHDLTKRATTTIDDEMVPLIDTVGSAYIEISGNTDSTGSRGGNMALSKRRAEVVVDYLVDEWEYPRERFKVVGNGPDAPLCNEQGWQDEGYDSLEDCRARNRTTRVAVLSSGS